MTGVALWGLHMGVTQGLLSALVADQAPEQLRATAFGIFNFAAGVAVLLASLMAGFLWQWIGPAATFVAGAAFTAVGLLVLLIPPPIRIEHLPYCRHVTTPRRLKSSPWKYLSSCHASKEIDQKGRCHMFESLDDQIKAGENREGGPGRRITLYAIYALAGVIVCYALVYGIHVIE